MSDAGFSFGTETCCVPVSFAQFARWVEQDVGGLDVPVEQPSGVGVMQGVHWRDMFSYSGLVGSTTTRLVLWKQAAAPI